jgi:hypothetical protein
MTPLNPYQETFDNLLAGEQLNQALVKWSVLYPN